MTFIVNAGVKNGVPQGQILKSKKLYRVVPRMKGFDEHFANQLKFWRYDVIWWRNNVKSFCKRKRTCLPPVSMYAGMRGFESMHARTENWSQCMPECDEGFCKILSALWATWFIFLLLYVIIFAQHLLPRQALHQYNISCIVVTKWRKLHWWHHFKVKVKVILW
jgi:hypothetical protein